MAKILKKDDDTELSFGDNITVKLPDMQDDNDEHDKNEYINTLLNNLDDDVWEKAKEQPKEKPNTSNVGLFDEVNKTHFEKKKLSKIDIILLLLIIICELMQWIFFATVTAKTFIITFICGMILIVGLSYLCNQYQMLFVQSLLLFIMLFTLISGKCRGLKWDQLSKMSMTKITYINENIPKKSDYNKYNDNEIVEKLSNKFIYYYRYGCSDCLATENVIEGILKKNNKEWIAVETRSPFGKRMLKKYPVQEVPAGLVINKDGSYTSEILYKKDDAGNPIVASDKMQKLLQLLKDE